MSTSMIKTVEEVSTLQQEFNEILGFDPSKKTPGNAAFNKAIEKIQQEKDEAEAKIVETCVEGIAKTLASIAALDKQYCDGVNKVKKSLKADVARLRNYKLEQPTEEKAEEDKPE